MDNRTERCFKSLSILMSLKLIEVEQYVRDWAIVQYHYTRLKRAQDKAHDVWARNHKILTSALGF
jgi:hypothetical protein